MDKKRWAGRLAFIAAIVAASVLPDWKMVGEMAAPQAGAVDVTTLVLMAFGLGVASYGLYLERHKLRAHMMRRLDVQLRLARHTIRRLHTSPGYPARAARRLFVTEGTLG